MEVVDHLASVLSFEEMLSPVRFDEFVTTALGKKHLLIPGVPGKLGKLVTWSSLNAALEEHRLEPPRLRLAHLGKRGEELAFVDHEDTRRGERVPRLRAHDIYRHMRAGATLVMDGVDEVFPPVKILAEQMARLFGAHVQVNLYASAGQDPGFGLHWDDHDVFVLQLAGEKDWQLFGPTRLFPQYRDVEENPAPTVPLGQWTLRESDVLYLPRGHWHNVRGLSAPTLHLTIGVNQKTGTDLFGWLRDEVRGLDIFRMDLPRFATEADKEGHARALREQLLQLWSDDVVSRYLSACDAVRLPRPHLGLPTAIVGDGLPQGDSFSLTWCIPCCPALRENDDAEVVFAAGGREWRLAAESEPILRLLFSGGLIPFSKLLEAAPSVASARIRRLVSLLAREGLLYATRAH